MKAPLLRLDPPAIRQRNLHRTLQTSILIILTLMWSNPTQAQLPPQIPVGSTLQERFFAAMVSAQQHEAKTAGGMGGTPFKEVFPNGGILVGLDVWHGGFHNAEVICGLAPIYQTISGRSRGKQYGNITGTKVTLEARDGYALAWISAYVGGDVVRALQLQFQKIDYSAFNLSTVSPYKSDLVGGKGRDNHLHPISSNSKPAIGIFGSGAMCIDRLGIIYAYEKP